MFTVNSICNCVIDCPADCAILEVHPYCNSFALLPLTIFICWLLLIWYLTSVEVTYPIWTILILYWLVLFVLLIYHSQCNPSIKFGELHFEILLLTAQSTTTQDIRTAIILMFECDSVVLENQIFIVIALKVYPLLSWDCGLLVLFDILWLRLDHLIHYF